MDCEEIASCSGVAGLGEDGKERRTVLEWREVERGASQHENFYGFFGEMVRG